MDTEKINSSSEEETVVTCRNIVKDYPLYSSTAAKLKALVFQKSGTKTFRALDDISLEMKKGECVGLIGLNGSGKSTLASIITGITAPTSGEVNVKGEVSMLCARSGMRSQLTGRDNIRFKCLLMGYTDKQIDEMEKDIIDFADIGIHIDQPVKTYSSGMRSRLGFAVAVHIDPDILIIDEALSVGDSSFTDKCLQKVEEFKKNGKTIVFVSHAVSAMTTFCDRVVWLHYGKMIGQGRPDEIIKPYCEFAKEFNAMNAQQRKKLTPELKKYQEKCGM